MFSITVDNYKSLTQHIKSHNDNYQNKIKQKSKIECIKNDMIYYEYKKIDEFVTLHIPSLKILVIGETAEDLMDDIMYILSYKSEKRRLELIDILTRVSQSILESQY